jgi:hypothetical protein
LRLRFGGQRHGDRFQLRELARQRAEALGVGDRAGVGEQAFEFLAAFGQGFEFAAQAGEKGGPGIGNREWKARAGGRRRIGSPR